MDAGAPAAGGGAFAGLKSAGSSQRPPKPSAESDATVQRHEDDIMPCRRVGDASPGCTVIEYAWKGVSTA